MLLLLLLLLLTLKPASASLAAVRRRGSRGWRRASSSRSRSSCRPLFPTAPSSTTSRRAAAPPPLAATFEKLAPKQKKTKTKAAADLFLHSLLVLFAHRGWGARTTHARTHARGASDVADQQRLLERARLAARQRLERRKRARIAVIQIACTSWIRFWQKNEGCSHLALIA